MTLAAKVERVRVAPFAVPMVICQDLPDDGLDFYAMVGEMERALVFRALKQANGNRTQAARLLRLNRTTFCMMLRKFNEGSKVA